MVKGILVKALSGFYYVESDAGLLECRARGRLRLEGLSPLVGDEVLCEDLGGGKGLAPACRLEDFLAGRGTARFGSVRPTFRPGVTGADLNRCLPPFVAAGLREAFSTFARQIRGFGMADAVLTAVESRTSAPVRILRGEDGQSLTHRGVYPVGEGAGYAGGIVSSAVDGLRAAEAIISQFCPQTG